MTALHVRTSTTVAIACALLSVGTVLSVGTGAAAAAAPANGCPAGYQPMSVAELSSQGYQVPASVDDPASGIRSFGSLGNHDGSVCGVPLGNQTTPWGGQVYNFWDNTLRA